MNNNALKNKVLDKIMKEHSVNSREEAEKIFVKMNIRVNVLEGQGEAVAGGFYCGKVCMPNCQCVKPN